MFKERLISSVILLAITIFAVILGGNILFAFILMISMIGLFEIYRVIGVQNKSIGCLGYLATIIYDFMILFQLEEYRMWLLIGFLMVLMSFYVFCFPEFNTEQIAIVFFGLFYVTIMLAYIYQVRMLKDGFLLIWLIFIGAWGSDTCAYCVGMILGKHKLAPKLSPKKTIEGALGGIAGAALIGFVYATILSDFLVHITNPQLVFALICGCASVISQIGDLAASAIKRNYNMKDYGKLIPGHGGILDRFDSIIFTAPIVYILAELMI